MTLKMNMCSVRLAATGKHLFDAPYCYSESVHIDGWSVARHDKVYYVPRELNDDERKQFVAEIKRLNDDQERKWNINQSI